jgi:hypothetical protein
VRSTRVVGIAAIVILVALVAGAVVLVATAQSSPTVVPSHLDVGAGPPSTATALLTYSDSNGVKVRGDCAFDFPAGAADVQATATLSVVSVSVEARLVDRALYFYVPQFASLVGAPWISTTALHGPARLEDLATALRHPDLSRLHPVTKETVTTDGRTTTTMHFGVVHVAFAHELPISVPGEGLLTVVVTTGAQGQLLDVGVTLAAPGDTVHLGFLVTGYDVPVSITAPPPDQVAELTATRASELFGADAATLQHLLSDLHHVVG